MMNKHLGVYRNSADIESAIVSLEIEWIRRLTCGECEYASRDENGEEVRDVNPEVQTTEFEFRCVEPQTLVSLCKETCYKNKSGSCVGSRS